MDSPRQRVKFLSEALPHIQKFRDKFRAQLLATDPSLALNF